MKYALGALVLALSITSAYAQNTSNSTAAARSRSNSQATAIGGGQGVGVGNGGAAASVLTVNSASIPSDTTVRTAPQVIAPGLSAAGVETCLGSISGGASVVGFGVSFGTSIEDESCTARLDARTLASLKDFQAAQIRMCLLPKVYQSMGPDCDVLFGKLQAQRIQQAERAQQIAETGYVQPEYTGGPVEVIERRTQKLRICDDYDVANTRCRVRLHN
jgi:hypothetical protein